MIRWSYGYRYLLAPEEYKPDAESLISPQQTLHRRQTMESDENTPFFHCNTRSTDSFVSQYPSEYDYYSTAGTSPAINTTMPRLYEQDVDIITSFPPPQEHGLREAIQHFLNIAWREFMAFMNMPLWAMLVAIVIALFPALQHHLFFEKNGFIRGSVIYAIQTCGDVSIPLILVILGANIANDDPPALEDSRTGPIVDGKLILTQRQRAIILGVATRIIIVPVTIHS